MFLNTPLYLPLELWIIIVEINKKKIMLLADLLEDELLFPEEYVNDLGQSCFMIEDFVEWPRYWTFIYENGVIVRAYHEYGCWEMFEQDYQYNITWQLPLGYADGVTDIWICEDKKRIQYIFHHSERKYIYREIARL